MKSKPRPLSPHLQVYRLQITSVLSITHRFTGLGLVAGLFALVYWLAAAAYGPDAFGRAQAALASWPGQVVLFGWIFCLFYHLANGIRHLAWDIGWGFDLPTLRSSGWAMLAAAVALTAITWIAAQAMRGG